jgi:ribosomal protein S18 acetylase RimI-like enzyme
MSVEIRPAEHADVDGIRSVAERAWYAAHEPIVGEAVVASFLEAYYDVESFRDRVDADDVILEVAVDDGVVGYVLAIPAEEDDGTVHLAHIYVAPDRWGEGVGRELLARVAAHARDLGVERVELAVMAGNDRAVAFYEAAGYRRTGSFYDDRADTRSYSYEKGL